MPLGHQYSTPGDVMNLKNIQRVFCFAAGLKCKVPTFTRIFFAFTLLACLLFGFVYSFSGVAQAQDVIPIQKSVVTKEAKPVASSDSEVIKSILKALEEKEHPSTDTQHQTAVKEDKSNIFTGSGHQMIMTLIFTILSHIAILLGIISAFYFVILLIRNEANLLEKVIRTTAAITGKLIYFGSKAVGVSIPSFMMKAVASTSYFSFGLFALIMPSAAGILVSWYIIKCIDRSEDIATRVVIMVSAFILVMFGDVYAASFSAASDTEAMMRYLVPNLTFTIAMCLYVILKYEHRQHRAPTETSEPNNT